MQLQKLRDRRFTVGNYEPLRAPSINARDRVLRLTVQYRLQKTASKFAQRIRRVDRRRLWADHLLMEYLSLSLLSRYYKIPRYSSDFWSLHFYHGVKVSEVMAQFELWWHPYYKPATLRTFIFSVKCVREDILMKICLIASFNSRYFRIGRIYCRSPDKRARIWISSRTLCCV